MTHCQQCNAPLKGRHPQTKFCHDCNRGRFRRAGERAQSRRRAGKRKLTYKTGIWFALLHDRTPEDMGVTA